MSGKTPSPSKILNDLNDIMTLVTHIKKSVTPSSHCHSILPLTPKIPRHPEFPLQIAPESLQTHFGYIASPQAEKRAQRRLKTRF